MSCRVNSSPVSILVGEDVYTAIFIRAIPAAATLPLQSTPTKPHHHHTLLVPGEMPSHVDVAPATAAFCCFKICFPCPCITQAQKHMFTGGRRQSTPPVPVWLVAASDRANQETTPVNNRQRRNFFASKWLTSGRTYFTGPQYLIMAETRPKNSGWHRPAPESTAFTGTSLIFFTLRSVDNRVLLNLASTRHQLAKQRLVLLAKCCFLFHLSFSISNFPTVYPTRSAIDRFKRYFSSLTAREC